MKKIFIISVLFFCFSCKKDSSESQNISKDSTNKILEIVNSARNSGYTCSGKKMPLAQNLLWDDELALMAQEHSISMEKQRKLSHDNLSQRISKYSKGYYFYAENVAMGSSTEEATLNQWFNSTSGHCENILNTRITHIGVGRSGNYWTMLLIQQK